MCAGQGKEWMKLSLHLSTKSSSRTPPDPMPPPPHRQWGGDRWHNNRPRGVSCSSGWGLIIKTWDPLSYPPLVIVGWREGYRGSHSALLSARFVPHSHAMSMWRSNHLFLVRECNLSFFTTFIFYAVVCPTMFTQPLDNTTLDNATRLPQNFRSTLCVSWSHCQVMKWFRDTSLFYFSWNGCPCGLPAFLCMSCQKWKGSARR